MKWKWAPGLWDLAWQVCANGMKLFKCTLGNSSLFFYFCYFSFLKTSFSHPIYLGDAPHLSTVTQCVSNPWPYMWWDLICARHGVSVCANRAVMSLFTSLPTPVAPEAWNCYSEELHFICIQTFFQNNFYPSARNVPDNVNVSRIPLPLQSRCSDHPLYMNVIAYCFPSTQIQA